MSEGRQRLAGDRAGARQGLARDCAESLLASRSVSVACSPCRACAARVRARFTLPSAAPTACVPPTRPACVCGEGTECLLAVAPGRSAATAVAIPSPALLLPSLPSTVDYSAPHAFRISPSQAVCWPDSCLCTARPAAACEWTKALHARHASTGVQCYCAEEPSSVPPRGRSATSPVER